MVPDCPRCGLHFEREAGYWTGAIAINIDPRRRRCSSSCSSIAIALTVPDIPVVPLLMFVVPFMAIGPLIVYPFSKTLWVAIDRAFLQRSAATSARRAGPAHLALVDGRRSTVSVRIAVDERPRRVADDREVLEVELRLLDELLRSAPGDRRQRPVLRPPRRGRGSGRASRRHRADRRGHRRAKLPVARHEHAGPAGEVVRARSRSA